MIRINFPKIRSILGLSFQLAKTNFKLRNEGSYLGILWYLLEPIVSFGVLMVVGGLLSQNTIPYYPIYLFIGLIMFNFFTAVTSSSSQAIVDNNNFLKSIKINPEVFVLSWIMQYIFSHLFEIILLVILGIFLKMNIVWFILYPIILIFFSLFTVGVSFIIATYSVYINDLKNVWSVITRLLWFVTPVFYVIPTYGWVHTLSMWNPMYHFINVTRDIIIFHRIIEIKTIVLAFVSSILVFAIGLYVFERNKSRFAEKL